MTDKNITIDALENGDVLLFSPEKGSFISWAITFLSEAPVSHAAMYYDRSAQTLIEESPPQVRVANVNERFVKRKIHVRRFKNKLDLSPVTAAATGYLNDETPYDDPGLYMVGLLLIYKKFAPDTAAQKIIIRILKRLTAMITKYIDERRYPGKLPMVCSQFVAQCYDDAGKPYKLHFEGAVLENAPLRNSVPNLLERVIAMKDNGTLARTQMTLESAVEANAPQESGEELCRQLQAALSDDENRADAIEQQPHVSDELTTAVIEFAAAHYALSSPDRALGNAADAAIDIGAALQHLQYNQNMFIAPGDLLQSCTSLETVGIIK